MKIENIRCEQYTREGPSIRGSEAHWEETPFTVMRIVTDDGVEGCSFGERSIDEPTLRDIRQLLIGKDPFYRELIWQQLWDSYGKSPVRPPGSSIVSTVDIALWDLAGKALGQPIYKLLGAYRDKVKVYASSGYLSSIQEYVDEVTSCKQRGITAYKLHVSPELAIDACRAVRRAGGDDMVLMLDPVGAYTRDYALRVGRELEKLNFYWYEEPIADQDIEGLAMLREKLDIPICATEKAPQSVYSIPEYLLRRAVDIVRCDTWLQGGITPCKKIADMCNAFNMQCELHNMVLEGRIANLHVECAVKNCEFYELRWPEPRYGFKEYPEIDDEGYIHVPQKPGLGVDVDWEKLGDPVAAY